MPPRQECVGRLGGVPHGIAVLTAADYFTLSSRSQAGHPARKKVAVSLPVPPARSLAAQPTPQPDIMLCSCDTAALVQSIPFVR